MKIIYHKGTTKNHLFFFFVKIFYAAILLIDR